MNYIKDKQICILTISNRYKSFLISTLGSPPIWIGISIINVK